MLQMRPMILPIKYLIVHHSASPRDTTSVETIRRWHVQDRGWADIGYHWIITGDGVLHPGRPLTMQGAHAPKVNPESWGICVTGDNTNPDQRWNGLQEFTLVKHITAVRFLLPEIDVRGHRDTGQATACPGLDIREWMKERGL